MTCNLKIYEELGNKLAKNYEPDEMVCMMAINFYHLIGLLWTRGNKTAIKEDYAVYLFCLVMGYFVNASKNYPDLDLNRVQDEVDNYMSLINKTNNLSVQEYLQSLLLEVDVSSAVPTPIMAKIAILNLVMNEMYPNALKTDNLKQAIGKIDKD